MTGNVAADHVFDLKQTAARLPAGNIDSIDWSRQQVIGQRSDGVPVSRNNLI
jgi:hypothetical protein